MGGYILLSFLCTPSVRGSKSSKKRKGSGIETHPMQPSCVSCKRQCPTYINVKRRESIYSEYWSLNRELRSDFMIQRIENHAVQRQRVRGSPKKNRKVIRAYTFRTESGDFRQVCSKFFLGTLGYKKDTVVTILFNKQSPSKSNISASTF